MARWALALALTFVPSLAAADWSLKAPKGWIRDSAEAESKLADKGQEHRPEVRSWTSPDSAKGPMLLASMSTVSTEDLPDPPAEIAKLVADSAAQLGQKYSLTVKKQKPPKVKGQTIEARLLEGTELRMRIQVRVVRARTRVRILSVICMELIAKPSCGPTIASIKM